MKADFDLLVRRCHAISTAMVFSNVFCRDSNPWISPYITTIYMTINPVDCNTSSKNHLFQSPHFIVKYPPLLAIEFLNRTFFQKSSDCSEFGVKSMLNDRCSWIYCFCCWISKHPFSHSKATSRLRHCLLCAGMCCGSGIGEEGSQMSLKARQT